VGFAGEADERESKAKNQHGDFGSGPINRNVYNQTAARFNYTSPGRWPANLIHDGSDEVVGLFPQTASGDLTPYLNQSRNGHAGVNSEWKTVTRTGDTGSAARFFYTAKASKEERQGVAHPTVKPFDLMAYLCRLVTPPGGVVLDPFMGSGTTIKAAISEGFQAIGIERDPAYLEMAQHRMDGAQLGLTLPVATPPAPQPPRRGADRPAAG
jgi:site-specific DNA-methyltransferase (adenine-specific)